MPSDKGGLNSIHCGSEGNRKDLHQRSRALHERAGRLSHGAYLGICSRTAAATSFLACLGSEELQEEDGCDRCAARGTGATCRARRWLLRAVPREAYTRIVVSANSRNVAAGWLRRKIGS